MISIITTQRARAKIASQLQERRVALGLTQEGLSLRSGVKLPTLRKFEQKGLISLESFLNLAMALGCLDAVVKATEPDTEEFQSIDDVVKEPDVRKRKRGWRK